MNATLSTRQLRLVAMLAVVVVAAGGYMVVAGHKTSTQPSTAHSTTPVSTPTQTTPAPSKAHAHAVTPAPAKLNTHGLPVKVALALRKNPVVVVSLSSPHSGVDQIASAEAQAGANEMGAGYVNLDVNRQRPGTAVLRKFGVFSTPAVLVVKRPGLVYSEFKGSFVDRDVVAQAVADAR